MNECMHVCIFQYPTNTNQSIQPIIIIIIQLLLPKNQLTTYNSMFQQKYHEVQKLISVGLSDRECSVRSCLLESIDSRFDPYLIQVNGDRINSDIDGMTIPS